MLISDWSSDVCSSDRGVVFKLFFTGRFKLLSTAIYVAMGWLVIVAIRPVMAALDGWMLGWLLAGGLFYTLGTVFYHRESIRYSHALWHLFCIAGRVCHYVAVIAQALPAPGTGTAPHPTRFTPPRAGR